MKTCRHIPAIASVWGQGKEDCCEFEASLVYKARLCLKKKERKKEKREGERERVRERERLKAHPEKSSELHWNTQYSH
jgi:hypothetical protein